MPAAPTHEPLTEHEERAWRAFYRMQSTLISTVARDLARGTGLSDADYEVMHALFEAPKNTMRALTLRNAVGWEKSRLSHHIGRMERRGLVVRQACDEDSRAFDVVLTPEGHDAIKAACCEHARAVRSYLLDALTPEQLTGLTEISDAVLARLASSADGR